MAMKTAGLDMRIIGEQLLNRCYMVETTLGEILYRENVRSMGSAISSQASASASVCMQRMFDVGITSIVSRE